MSYINSFNKIQSLAICFALLFSLNLNAQYNVGSASSATGTINDNDEATITVADLSVAEDIGDAVVTFSLDKEIDIPITVTMTTSSMTASFNTDYNSSGLGNVTIPANSTASQTVSVTIINDNIVEASETFRLVPILFPNLNTQIGTRSITDVDGICTINDNDTAIFSISDASATEGTGSATFTVSLDKEIDIPVDIKLGTSSFTAVSNLDFQNNNNIIATFPANSTTSQNLSLPITDDDLVEATETFFATMSTSTALNGRYVVTTDVGNGTINDNDQATFTISDASTTEGSSNPTFTISLDKAIDMAVDVQASFSGGTATGGGTDYTSTAQTVSFPGYFTTPKTVTVGVTDDLTVEASETFIASIANASSTGDRMINISDTGNGTINDNDQAIISIDDVTVDEGDGTANFTVSTSKPIDIPMTINVDFTDGTATGNNPVGSDDYNNGTLMVTLPANSTNAQMASVPINDDNTPENDEDFTATLSVNGSAMGRDLNTSDTGTGTILDNDCPCDPACSFIPTPADEGTVLTATIANTIGDYTHYCDASGKLLLSIKNTGANVPAAAVTYKIENQTLTGKPEAMQKQFCGGGFFGGCFISNTNGAPLYNRQWDIDESQVTGGVTTMDVVSYFHMSDILAMTNVEPMEYPNPVTDYMGVQLWKINDLANTIPAFPQPTAVGLFQAFIAKYSSSGTTSEVLWANPSFSTQAGIYGAEFHLGNLKGGAGLGGTIKP